MFRRLGLSLAAVLAGSLIIGIANPAAAQPVAAPAAQVANVAHRGASAYAPENTIAAFRLARAQRADMFELDVQETKDHQLILMHDTTLARTTDVESVYPDRAPWPVSAFTLAEIRKLDAGSWFGAKYAGERVPTLAEALRSMRGSGLGLLLEVKAPSLYPGIEGRIAAELRRHPSWLRPDPSERLLVVQSFDFDSMRRFHAIMPRVPVGLLGTPAVEDLPELAGFADQINPNHGALTAEYVQRVHRLRMEVFTWTVDDPAAMRRVIGLGVDGVITNKPDVLGDVLGEGAASPAAA
ncbi:hydrolase [Actinomadura viridis]|uniref:Glycerophosphoryl diester phosphodiesterase n=1 Tax=Actinomadura viridis TaxID=58110 RepID=A0A931GMM5_9ACTN|nr:glycerophosphodiester phosphodiesterase family protein [Actinomadura viridis]MBG6092822.1 glycerophosphoryl diester phosphodiesterase [Actinomadura viridis]